MLVSDILILKGISEMAHRITVTVSLLLYLTFLVSFVGQLLYSYEQWAVIT